MTTPVWIGLGSNLGDRKATLDAAVAALADAPGVAVRAVSPCHETAPVGGPPGQGAFLNAAARLDSTLGPFELLAVTQGIENHLGRVRTVRWGERTLDLDILIYGTKFLDTKDLKLPHPRLALRRFVLAPLAEIAPNIVDTMTGRTIADLLANLDRRPRLVAIDGPPGSTKASVYRSLTEVLPAFGIEGFEQDPIPGRDSERLARDSESFARKVEALHADPSGCEATRYFWHVVTFFLDPRSIHSAANLPPEVFQDDGPMSEWAARMSAEEAWSARIRRAEDRAMVPIFVVELPGTPGTFRRPGLVSVPQLWPDSDEPDAIVAEVLATCRAIEGA